ncbi:hypothetical protein BD779DRAFT_608479 [Infundibulicybe gibba]|nr:hypothetical protein BD779DRAFT_608479 [Infundibulicybe gibba]
MTFLSSSLLAGELRRYTQASPIHRIVHRDIDWKNILINHFSHNGDYSRREKSSYRASPHARYCLFDFDLSLIVPKDVERLPSALATVGSPYNHPQDINQGEFDYDPFAYDVASMGNMLARFDYVIPTVPLLAPLLDQMTTHIVTRRFTAPEALKFCSFIRESLTVKELDTRLDPEPQRDGYCRDRWAHLPPDFVRTWSAYRESPPSYQIRVLRWIGCWDLGWRLLRFIRGFLRI